jgi:hypothetical protein
LFVLASFAFATTCPVPDASAPVGPVTLSADGAAHVLTHDAAQACWWIVDDRGDPRLGAHWERAWRDPLMLAALFDGRVAVIFREAGKLALAVRDARGSERHYGLLFAEAPQHLLAHATLPVVALVWPDGSARVVDVESGRVLGDDLSLFTWSGADAPR